VYLTAQTRLHHPSLPYARSRRQGLTKRCSPRLHCVMFSVSTSGSVIQLAATCAFGAVAELDLVRLNEAMRASIMNKTLKIVLLGVGASGAYRYLKNVS
jgi:hypothetical protein